MSHRIGRREPVGKALRRLVADDLNAAQLRTARALVETERVRTELHALKATRTFRYTASLRNIYATLRRVFS